ncbi:MAG: DUF3078 domain-containing protein [Prevotellaceae bacterium]|jgi:hypothetical protein|nr:DUF3078 domain-containing protein [Prevotellaceae bacterium]
MRPFFVFLIILCTSPYAFSQQTDTVPPRRSPAVDTAATAAPDSVTAAPDTVVPPPAPAPKDTVVPPPAPAPKTSGWKMTHLVRLNLSQTAYFYWSSGGDNSWATNTFYTFTANYKNENWAWDTKLDTEYGLVYIEQAVEPADFSWLKRWKKNADKIQLSTTFGYTHNSRLYYSFLGEFKTQYSPDKFLGNYSSVFMAPGYLNMGLGADYKRTDEWLLFGLLPVKDFTAFMSPFTARLTFVLNSALSQAGAFGVEPGRRVKEQMGMAAKVAFKTRPMENVSVSTTLNLFTPYEDKFLNFVVGWDAVVAMKINRYLSTTLNISLQYDEKIQAMKRDGTPLGGPRVQFKEILGVGITYTF